MPTRILKIFEVVASNRARRATHAAAIARTRSTATSPCKGSSSTRLCVDRVEAGRACVRMPLPSSTHIPSGTIRWCQSHTSEPSNPASTGTPDSWPVSATDEIGGARGRQRHVRVDPRAPGTRFTCRRLPRRANFFFCSALSGHGSVGS